MKLAGAAVGVAAAAAVISVYAENNGLGALPPMGWATWCTDDICGLFDYCAESEVKGVADALVSSGMRDLGYNLVFLDDCWAGNRSADGALEPDYTRFPSGMSALADYMHERDLLFGLYTCAGEYTCKNKRPGSLGHYTQDANTFAHWNIDYVKMDNCGHPNEPQQEYYGNFSRALNATGRPMWFNVCGWGYDDVEVWGPQIANSFRITGDHLPLWSKQRAGVGGVGTLQVIETMGQVSNCSVPGGWADPDFLETLFPITMDYTNSVTEFSLWALWAAPLIVATDVRNMTEQKQSILMNSEVVDVNQDAAALPGVLIRNDTMTSTSVWRKWLAGKRGPSLAYDHEQGHVVTKHPSVGLRGQEQVQYTQDGTYNMAAVVLFNAQDSGSQDISLTWEEVGFDAGATVEVYDLWAHESVGTFENGYTATVVPPHGVAMWRLTVQQ